MKDRPDKLVVGSYEKLGDSVIFDPRTYGALVDRREGVL
jgi:hypothetical protein